MIKTGKRETVRRQPKQFEGNSPFAKQRQLSLAIKAASTEVRAKEVTPERAAEIARQLGSAASERLFLMEKPMTDTVPVAAAAAQMAEGTFDLSELNKLSVQITGNTLKMAEPGAKKIALFAADDNVWASELLYAHKVAKAAGYDVELFTPSGEPPKFLDPSTTVDFRDLPRNGIEVTPGEGALAAKYTTEGTPEHAFLTSAKPISSLIPQEPHPKDALGNDPTKMAADYAQSVENGIKNFSDRFQTVWVAGGSGGFQLHQRNLELILSGAAANKMPIAVNCYGANALMHAKTADGRDLIEGHTLAVHTNTHDWKYEPYRAQPPFSLQDGVEARGATVIARPMEHTISALSTNRYGETIATAASTHDGLATMIQVINLLQNGGAKKGETKVVVNLERERPVNAGDRQLSAR